MKLTLTEVDKDNLIHVAAEGKITSGDFQSQNASPFEVLIGNDWATRKIVMNLEKISYIDSMAIGWLIDCHKRVKAAGGIMVLHSVHPSVQQVFNLMRINTIFPIANGKDGAVEKAMG